jgi:MYXO-CTERM domain-containing protein
MKNSIGSLSALAALALPAALPAEVIPATFANFPLSLSDPTPISFDFDGDSSIDFQVFGNSGSSILFEPSAGNFRTVEVNFGDSLLPSDAVFSGLDSVFPGQSPYYGFSFLKSGQAHSAWVRFDLTSPTPQISAGAWQNTPGAGIVVGAVPEPASFAAFVGMAALCGAALRRRRRDHPSPPDPCSTA